MLDNLQQMHVKLLEKKQFKEHLEKLGIGLVIKLLIKLQTSEEPHHRITQTFIFETEIPVEKNISPEKSQKITNDLILI